MKLRIPNMSREIATQTDAQIERDTALKWAGRAIALCKRAKRTGNLSLVFRAIEYRHEAIEHAASVGDNGRTLAALQRQLDKAMMQTVKGRKR